MRSMTAVLTALLFSIAHAAALLPAGAATASAPACSGMPCCAEKASCAASAGCAAHRDGDWPGASSTGACLQAAACGHAAPGAVVPTLDPARVAAAAPLLAPPAPTALASSPAARPPSLAPEPVPPPPRA